MTMTGNSKALLTGHEVEFDVILVPTVVHHAHFWLERLAIDLVVVILHFLKRGRNPLKASDEHTR